MRKVEQKPIRREEAEDYSANSILVFITLMLFVILAILEIDLHRDALKSIGVVFDTKNLDGRFVGP